ncbi:NIN-like protein [Tanacetum coccineum]
MPPHTLSFNVEQVEAVWACHGAMLFYSDAMRWHMYENINFFTERNQREHYFVCDNIKSPQPKEFRKAAKKLLRDLAAAAPRASSFYAASTRQQGDGNATAYAIAQCNLNVSQSVCSECLKTRSLDLDDCFPAITGRAMDTACFIRYSRTPFFGQNQTTDISSLLWDDCKDGRTHRPGAPALNGAGYYSHKQLQLATKNFSEENIIGKGGFGEIADFRLARFQPEGKSHVMTKCVGTLGYTAPEYVLYGSLSDKVDTFSFGIVTLEIISGRRCAYRNFDGPSTDCLLEHAWKLYENKNHIKLVDDTLDANEYEDENVMKIIEIALLCTQSPVSKRPTMAEVFVILLNDQSLGDRQPSRPNFNDHDRRIYMGSSQNVIRNGNVSQNHKELEMINEQLHYENAEDQVDIMEKGMIIPDSTFGNEEELFQSESAQPMITSGFELRDDNINLHKKTIQDKIIAALKQMTFREQHVIVQVWSPAQVVDQPFGLGEIKEQLTSYRKESQHNLYVLDNDHEEEELSPPARVFRRRLPEWTPDVVNYLPKQFPQKESAIRHNLVLVCLKS